MADPLPLLEGKGENEGFFTSLWGSSLDIQQNDELIYFEETLKAVFRKPPLKTKR